jgi:hypothetical protein
MHERMFMGIAYICNAIAAISGVHDEDRERIDATEHLPISKMLNLAFRNADVSAPLTRGYCMQVKEIQYESRA